MIRENVTYICDLKTNLKDLSHCILNPKLLRTGRKFKNFDLLPREALGNWLICACAQKENLNWTYSEDPSGGDGRILDLDTMNATPVEHVYVPPKRKTTEKNQSVECQILNAIKKKVKKGGESYSKGKILVVFSEANGEYKPNIVARKIFNKHKFEAIYLVGLENTDSGKYCYWVSQLNPNPILNSNIWKIEIKNDFEEWEIKRAQ